jgi:hypothetical protein
MARILKAVFGIGADGKTAQATRAVAVEDRPGLVSPISDAQLQTVDIRIMDFESGVVGGATVSTKRAFNLWRGIVALSNVARRR